MPYLLLLSISGDVTAHYSNIGQACHHYKVKIWLLWCWPHPLHAPRWMLQPNAVNGAKGAQVVIGRQESKQRTYLFTCVRDFIQYARLWKNIFWTTV